ncbi:hypothetical protein [Streptomyces sp. TRM70350]|uniref:hypothetical protein n=1 Tax=Streptomyces sp. TRM70350 TaxID=2856165 RepID=UPI00210F673C|nr:hypothetical protein [Streptomyces sp. TRM70350]
MAEPDEPAARDDKGRLLTVADGAPTDPDSSGNAPDPAGCRIFGKSKDSRDDLPQIVIGMAVTRDGIPSGSGPGPATPVTRN